MTAKKTKLQQTPQVCYCSIKPNYYIYFPVSVF